MDLVRRGNLFKFMVENPDFFRHEQNVVQLFAKVCEGVHYMHKRDMVHRDIKPENILIDQDLEPKLCDFGWTTKLMKNEARQTFCGTFDYMAPEILESKNYNSAVDVWSSGIILFELLHGYSPYKSKNAYEIFLNISTKPLVFKDGLNPKIKDLICNMLDRNPSKRPTMLEVLRVLAKDFGSQFDDQLTAELDNTKRRSEVIRRTHADRLLDSKELQRQAVQVDKAKLIKAGLADLVMAKGINGKAGKKSASVSKVFEISRRSMISQLNVGDRTGLDNPLDFSQRSEVLKRKLGVNPLDCQNALRNKYCSVIQTDLSDRPRPEHRLAIELYKNNPRLFPKNPVVASKSILDLRGSIIVNGERKQRSGISKSSDCFRKPNNGDFDRQFNGSKVGQVNMNSQKTLKLEQIRKRIDFTNKNKEYFKSTEQDYFSVHSRGSVAVNLRSCVLGNGTAKQQRTNFKKKKLAEPSAKFVKTEADMTKEKETIMSALFKVKPKLTAQVGSKMTATPNPPLQKTPLVRRTTCAEPPRPDRSFKESFRANVVPKHADQQVSSLHSGAIRAQNSHFKKKGHVTNVVVSNGIEMSRMALDNSEKI
jgi:serine/threonine protein kinase